VNQLSHQAWSRGADCHHAAVSVGKFTLGNNAVLKLEARAWLMVSSISAHNGSAPGTGEMANESVRLTLQEGVSTNQLA
jgi:hypothetical protein